MSKSRFLKREKYNFILPERLETKINMCIKIPLDKTYFFHNATMEHISTKNKIKLNPLRANGTIMRGNKVKISLPH